MTTAKAEKVSLGQRIENLRQRMYLAHVGSKIMRGLVYSAATITLGVLIAIIIYIVVKGIPNLKPELFSLKYTSENSSMMPAIINTLIVTALALLMAVPTGIFSAIYLVEYAKKGNKLVNLVRITTETLQGIPSIVYGLFGYLFLVIRLKDYSIFAGSVTVAIMILPLIMRTSEEALMAVPDMYREGSFGLGAGKLRTVFTVVLPSAVPGILSGVVLGIGRIVGETAALMYSAGTVAKVPSSIFRSGRTLSVHMWCLYSEGLHTDASYATALVLLVLVVGLNALSEAIAKKVGNK